MTLELLKKNIEREKELIKELNIISNQYFHLKNLQSSNIAIDLREKSGIDK